MLKTVVVEFVAAWEYEEWPAHQQSSANGARVVAVDYDRAVPELLQVKSNFLRRFGRLFHFRALIVDPSIIFLCKGKLHENAIFISNTGRHFPSSGRATYLECITDHFFEVVNFLEIAEERQQIFDVQQAAFAEQLERSLNVIFAGQRAFGNEQPQFALQLNVAGPGGGLLGKLCVECERQLDGRVPQLE